jgi:hypothetical protein
MAAILVEVQAAVKQKMGSDILDSIMTGCATAQVNLNGLGSEASRGAVAYVCTAISEVFDHAVSPLCACPSLFSRLPLAFARFTLECTSRRVLITVS